MGTGSAWDIHHARTRPEKGAWRATMWERHFRVQGAA
jgi:hypothetical protein